MRVARQSFTRACAWTKSGAAVSFTGRVTGSCYVQIENDTLLVAQGTSNPTATVRTDIDLWLRILSYEIDGLMAYQAGQYQVEGDLETLMESDTWFRR
jgi:putative sterol carrier protein